jgi:hypothetical protein
MIDKPVATESDINETTHSIGAGNTNAELDSKLMLLAQELDIINERAARIEHTLEVITAALQAHRHSPTGEPMFPLR